MSELGAAQLVGAIMGAVIAVVIVGIIQLLSEPNDIEL